MKFVYTLVADFIRLFLIAFLVGSVFSCEKAETQEPKEPELPKEYYVEYTAETRLGYFFISSVSYASPEGFETASFS